MQQCQMKRIEIEIVKQIKDSTVITLHNKTKGNYKIKQKVIPWKG